MNLTETQKAKIRQAGEALALLEKQEALGGK